MLLGSPNADPTELIQVVFVSFQFENLIDEVNVVYFCFE